MHHIKFFFLFLCTVNLLSTASFAASFKEALIQAYWHNPELLAERAALKNTDEQAALALSNFLPSANVNYTRGKEYTTLSGSPEIDSITEIVNGEIQQPLFRGGASLAQYKQAKHAINAARATLKSTEQAILINAITAYLDVLQYQELLKVNQHNVKVLKTHLKLTKEREKLGEVTRTDVAQAKSRLAQGEADKATAEGLLEQSKAIYEQVITEKPQSLIPLKSLPPIPGDLSDIQKIALESNPNIIAAKSNLEAAKKDISIQKASIFPTVSLLGGINKTEGNTGFFGASRNIRNESIRVNVNVPLYQTGSEYARIRQAKHIKKQQALLVTNAETFVKQTVISNWQNVQTTRATKKATSQAVKATELALDGVKEEAKYGTRTTLDVLDAEQEFFTAQTNWIQAKRNEALAHFRILEVMGELTPQALELDITPYDTEEHYKKVRHKFIGWDTD